MVSDKNGPSSFQEQGGCSLWIASLSEALLLASIDTSICPCWRVSVRQEDQMLVWRPSIDTRFNSKYQTKHLARSLHSVIDVNLGVSVQRYQRSDGQGEAKAESEMGA
jgi:hypothetical protein